MSQPDWAEGCVLVLGAEGMLGRELVPQLSARQTDGHAGRLVRWDIEELDIRDRDAVLEAVGALKPNVVVNTAAYTDVDGCETHAELAMAVNAKGPSHIAAACTDVGATLVHFGTDFVFDGRAQRPYGPDDPPNPLSVYGRSKWEGEQVIRAAACRHLIIRTSWLFGPGGRNFVETILAKAEAGERLHVVTDQVGSPTLAADLAHAVVKLLDAGTLGTFHFANSGQCSWFGFAQEIISQAGINQRVEPITSVQLKRPAQRPAYSVLDTANCTETTGLRPPPWQDALRRYLHARCGLNPLVIHRLWR